VIGVPPAAITGNVAAVLFQALWLLAATINHAVAKRLERADFVARRAKPFEKSISIERALLFPVIFFPIMFVAFTVFLSLEIWPFPIYAPVFIPTFEEKGLTDTEIKVSRPPFLWDI